MREEDRHYVAGLFDGEGWFSILKSSRKDTRIPMSFQCRASLAMTDFGVVDWLCNTCGGSMSKKSGRKTNHKDIFTWIIGDTKAMEFAENIHEKLRVKKNQAEVLISFQRLRLSRSPRYSPISVEEYLDQKCHYLMMRDLNERGPKRETTGVRH